MVTHRVSDEFLASRVRDAAPSPTLAVSDKARSLKAQGIDVIDLGGGDPDFITPDHVRQAATDAMNGGDTHYVASTGTPALRSAIAKKLKQDNGIEVNPATQVIVTPGGKSALFETALALVEPGVDVLVLTPAWVSYIPMVELAGGRAIEVSLSPDDNFTVTRDILESHVTSNSRVIMLNSPNNPTGRVLTLDELTTIAEFSIAHDLLVWTDEIYEKILYGSSTHHSIATLPGMKDRTLTFNGLSKAYAMTGWRLGYVVGHPDFISEIAKVHSHSATCATSFAQAGGVAALNGPQGFIGEMVTAWKRRRNLVTDGLNRVNGLRISPIEGAFYALVDGRETGLDSVTLGDRILQEAHVAVVPGIAFGAAGEGHFRLSFATGDALLTESVARIQKLFGTR
ncbi:MAG: pyridoxal phosphate-dependent aminotransferase [Thermomicrobiales bacterium]